MADTSFETRVAQLSSQRPQSQRPPQAVKAQNRRQKLQLALAHLHHGGVTGEHAYSKLFRGLAKIGLIVKPLHYWSWVGLALFGSVVFTLIFGLTLGACMALDHYPRPVRAMIDAGPSVFVAMVTSMSVVFAAVHKLKANAIGLPRWRDL